jgi:hypothetical protein
MASNYRVQFKSERVLNDIQRTKFSCGLFLFGSSHILSPPLLFRQEARPATHRNIEKEIQLADGRGRRGGGGRGAKSLNRKKA